MACSMASASATSGSRVTGLEVLALGDLTLLLEPVALGHLGVSRSLGRPGGIVVVGVIVRVHAGQPTRWL